MPPLVLVAAAWVAGLILAHHGLVPLGVEPGVRRATAPLPEGLAAGEFLYFPAATWPHKGHDRLLHAFAALRRTGQVKECLVLTGQRTPLWEQALLPLARKLGVEGNVLHLGFVPREQVDSLLGAARAVVYPTRYEGFGLPVVEAAAAGARIVASRLEVFDEIGLPRENQVDFDVPEQVAAALDLPAPTLLAHEPLSWREVARRTIDVLREAGKAR